MTKLEWDEVDTANPYVRSLLRLVCSTTRPNANLFYGSNESGLKDVVSLLIAANLCEHARSRSLKNPCLRDDLEQCPSCKQVRADHHPDLMVIDSNKKNINVDMMLEVQKFLEVSPQQRSGIGTRVVLIQDAELMTLAAANSFLKTLEELPKWGDVFFVSTKRRLLPVTILSRVMQWRIAEKLLKDAPLRNGVEDKAQNTDEEWSGYLGENQMTSFHSCQALAKIYAKAPGEFLQTLEGEINHRYRMAILKNNGSIDFKSAFKRRQALLKFHRVCLQSKVMVNIQMMAESLSLSMYQEKS